ncbi:WYL domain-containing protein [Aquabacterium soli]|uniref:WYL domain-containing protein n=1 Tax=Aquabacterium soli TaxID=2493092 RepID=A0A426VAZ1_9BURK|nr:WYL domain-containing protein [Aquabacterium soli]RRS04063.1 WYL domain-containing protein [Aquabacterium soli]
MATQTARVTRIEAMLRLRGHINFQALVQELEVSPATVKRDLAFLRDQLGCPIKYNRAEDVYRLDPAKGVGDRFEIPGLWLNQEEVLALLISHQLLAGLDPNGALARHVDPLLERIRQLLGDQEDQSMGVSQRLLVMPTSGRQADAQYFEAVCAALLRRKQLTFNYFTRSREQASTRLVSPQRMVHHRNTWYLDAWCHDRQALRRFSLDAITDTALQKESAIECAQDSVEAYFDIGYGVYAGAELRHAHLVFSPWAAKWVVKEQWHRNQTQRVLSDKRLELVVPYTDAAELKMDIMRYGAEVEVLGPPELREDLALSLRCAANQYDEALPATSS